MNFLDSIWLIPLFPAAGFAINGLFGKRFPKAAIDLVACGSVLISFIFALGAVFQLVGLDENSRSHTVIVFEWINGGLAHTSAGEMARFSTHGVNHRPTGKSIELEVPKKYCAGYYFHQGETQGKGADADQRSYTTLRNR